MNTRLFLSNDVDAIHGFSMGQLDENLSPVEAEMHSWQQPWRKESLEHYAQLGWSFVAQEGDEVLGYILGQPILFFNNWTQTLWIESLAFVNDSVGFELMDVAIRWSKTKHLQKVLMNTDCPSLSFVEKNFPGFKQKNYLHISTTKMSED